MDGGATIMVSGTSGTTVFGTFDNLNSIARVCEKYDIWMHVVAARGGGALISPKYRHLLNGIEKADSVTWNSPKMCDASQQCSTFLSECLFLASHYTRKTHEHEYEEKRLKNCCRLCLYFANRIKLLTNVYKRLRIIF
uniref:Uncharacterized protein n=1 Tax=Glossina palpalis gambiensis TaxID=67801 RepID=A0A1B0BVU4_9MUSC